MRRPVLYCFICCLLTVTSTLHTYVAKKDVPTLVLVMEPSQHVVAQPVLYHLRHMQNSEGAAPLRLHPVTLAWHDTLWFEERTAHELLIDDVPQLSCSGASTAAQRHTCALTHVAATLEATAATAVMVFGSSPSAWAATEAAAFAGVPVIAVDAGWPGHGLPHQPTAVLHETRRRAVDAACDLCFVATAGAVRLLTKQGVPMPRIRFVGSTVVDATASLVHQSHYYDAVDIEHRYPFLFQRVLAEAAAETGAAADGPTAVVPFTVQQRLWRVHLEAVLADAGVGAPADDAEASGVDGEALVELTPGGGPAQPGQGPSPASPGFTPRPRALVVALFTAPVSAATTTALGAVGASNYAVASGGAFSGATVVYHLQQPSAAFNASAAPSPFRPAHAPFKAGLSAKETCLLLAAASAVVTDSDDVKVAAVAMGVPVVLLRAATPGTGRGSAADTDPGLASGAVQRLEPHHLTQLVASVGAALRASAQSLELAAADAKMADVLATARAARGAGADVTRALELAAVRLFPTGERLASPLDAVFTRLYGDGGAGHRVAKLSRAAVLAEGGVAAYVAATEERWGPDAPATRIRYHRDRITNSMVGVANHPGTTPPFAREAAHDVEAAEPLLPLQSASAPAFFPVVAHAARKKAAAAAAAVSPAPSPPPVPAATNPPVFGLYAPSHAPSQQLSHPPPLPAALASTLEQPYQVSQMLSRLAAVGLPPWHTLQPDAVTVVLTVFKRNNLRAQVEALMDQTHPPAVVYVFQNGNYTDVSDVVAAYPSLRHVHSPRHNFMFHGRLLLAALADTEYFMIFDDDVLPQRRWIENCIRASREHHAVVGSNGRRLNRGQGAFYEDGRRSHGLGDGSPVPHDTEVDLVGHAILFRSEWAVHLWGQPPFTIMQGEDFAVSATAALAAGIRAVVPRQQPSEETMSDTRPELGMDAVASYKKPSHQRRIDIGDYYSAVRGWVPLCVREFDCEEFIALYDDDKLPTLPD